MKVDTLKRFLEHAPRDPGTMAPDLVGWWITCDDGLRYLCARCAGRIMARGCSIGQCEAVWDVSPGKITGICEGCEA